MLVPLAHLGHFVSVAPFVMPPLVLAAGIAAMALLDRIRGS